MYSYIATHLTIGTSSALVIYLFIYLFICLFIYY